MDFKGLVVVLLILTFLGITLPQVTDAILTGNSTLTSDPAYPLLRLTPTFIAVFTAFTFIYWAYEENKN